MKKVIVSILTLFLITNYSWAQKTIVSIKENQFYINGEPTYKGRYWNGNKIEGLLFNSRMVQGVFDDENPETRVQFVYPDTKKWDPNRNTKEFVKAMEDWYDHGLLSFTLNLQGGSPIGYGNKQWVNNAFEEDGSLKKAYFSRLNKILKKADKLGMVVILGYFYFGQDQFLKDEKAIITATDQTTEWLVSKGYKNILIEVNNETTIHYDHDILKPDRVDELIVRIKEKDAGGGYHFPTGTSFSGAELPVANVVKVSDFLLLHGNGVKESELITKMVEDTKQIDGYDNQPILFNEDDHYDFEKENNNMVAAVKAYASWGFFDFRRKGESYEEGYQSVPVDWKISSKRKKDFFNKVKEITGK
ncbi:hypothetical protein [Chondrinema litorale]|uniref:hypothetical protein n=1 Tax=Chondrinema litorale TaxID=2994555 RepID=UPI002543F8C0|nr:hypothetical protein [Chondrinema litorale]UZR97010.1 hypothetical protein OQ292_23205 [Chondrinema litorale]